MVEPRVRRVSARGLQPPAATTAAYTGGRARTRSAARRRPQACVCRWRAVRRLEHNAMYFLDHRMVYLLEFAPVSIPSPDTILDQLASRTRAHCSASSRWRRVHKARRSTVTEPLRRASRSSKAPRRASSAYPRMRLAAWQADGSSRLRAGSCTEGTGMCIRSAREAGAYLGSAGRSSSYCEPVPSLLL